MFCSLFKAKLEIEAKVSSLQKRYLEILALPIRKIEFTNENNLEIAKNLLLEKIETVDKILVEYKSVLNQHHQTGAEIIEAKETAEEFEDYLDNLFELFEIEIPEEFKQSEQDKEISQILPVQDSELNENSENSKDFDEEEEDSSDKENSVLSSPGGGYFSPNIQIQKSIINPNEALYTPAVKSSSKLPYFKRNL